MRLLLGPLSTENADLQAPSLTPAPTPNSNPPPPALVLFVCPSDLRVLLSAQWDNERQQ
ncbi:hypothetical protein JZ751_027845 [Albula glossodonta]|uniref:Uncharacterized protein n=1 Tax=Albula glossodonta TaxID=121402 RepID=A0A8T2PIF3_9TELE|nr:hypothetical protein JZ751_027845 [Albula glossodonta]